MKGLFAAIILLIIVGVGGFFYRNIVDNKPAPLSGACTAEAKVCPDGSAVGRVAPVCNFAPCAAPNVTLMNAGIVFLPPSNYASTTPADTGVLADFVSATTTSNPQAGEILVRDYAIPDGQTAADILHATAISGASGMPVSPSAFSAATIGGHTYSVVVLERFEGVVHVAYYWPRDKDVLRFESIDRGVVGWTDSSLDVTKLQANHDLRTMLSTIENN